MLREIVHIDEEKCDGCGLCVPACEEGAIRIANGKAKLVADRLCDGMGACLGHCPRGAITIERREADEFDEELVARHAAPLTAPLTASHQIAPPTGSEHVGPNPTTTVSPPFGGCPGAAMARFSRIHTAGLPETSAGEDTPSDLTHWPVQLNLLPPHAPVLRGARLLIAADCVPIAYADFHRKLLRGRVVLIGCPKFDNLADYVDRLTAIFERNELREVVVARMEVPCCGGIVSGVREARRRSGVSVPVTEVVVSTRGDITRQHELPLETEVS